MDRVIILDAVSKQDTSELSGSDKAFGDNLLATLHQTSTEFHADMLHLLNSVTEENDFSDLVTVVNSLRPQLRTQLIAFVTTGEATEEFMHNLDQDSKLQHAVDIAFAAHIGQLHDLGKALNNVEEFLQNNDGGEDVDIGS